MATPVFTIKDHVLLRGGRAVAQRATPNVGGVMTPDMLIMHYTAAQSAAGAIAWLCNPAKKVSAHLVIAVDGAVTQLAPFNRVCWHAGKSHWKKRTGCNAFSIGVEMANPGPLNKLGNGKFADLNGQSIPAARAAWLRHRLDPAEKWWATYPSAQREAAIAVAQAICAAYRIVDICGHDEIAPERKRDPGPAFEMDNFVSRVRGRQ